VNHFSLLLYSYGWLLIVASSSTGVSASIIASSVIAAISHSEVSISFFEKHPERISILNVSATSVIAFFVIFFVL